MPQLARCAQSPATPNRSPWPASPRPTTARCRQSEAEIDALLLLAPARSPPPSAPRSCARSASTGPGNNCATVPVDRHGPGPCPVARHRRQLSGGLRQRAMIAMALSCNPRLLLADEPTTAPDGTVQGQVLILLRRLQRELGMGMIFVTHDLGVASEIADTVAVMYAGRIVESGPVAQVLSAPAHPYTAGLLASTVHGQPRERDIDAIPGSPPDMRRLPRGCSFAPRCARRIAQCRLAVPEPRFPEPGRMAACLVAAGGRAS